MNKNSPKVLTNQNELLISSGNCDLVVPPDKTKPLLMTFIQQIIQEAANAQTQLFKKVCRSISVRYDI
jgi:hypothetical protein